MSRSLSENRPTRQEGNMVFTWCLLIQKRNRREMLLYDTQQCNFRLLYLTWALQHCISQPDCCAGSACWARLNPYVLGVWHTEQLWVQCQDGFGWSALRPKALQSQSQLKLLTGMRSLGLALLRSILYGNTHQKSCPLSEAAVQTKFHCWNRRD